MRAPRWWSRLRWWVGELSDELVKGLAMSVWREHGLEHVMEEPVRVRARGRGTPAPEDAPTPTEERLADGQYADHWVLSPAERAKGFVRPVRHSYRHVGLEGPRYPLRELTAEEKDRFAAFRYVAFEVYPDAAEPLTGRYWTQAKLDAVGQGCGAVTTMTGHSLAETYARDPHFYGSTFCVGCRDYLSVAEFVWEDDGTRVGS